MSVFKRDKEITSGDMVISNGRYPNLMREFFYNGPLKVVRVEDGPGYAGGKFVYVEYGLQERGLYINGIKKA